MTPVHGARPKNPATNITPESPNLPRNDSHIFASALISATSEMMSQIPLRAHDVDEHLSDVRKNPHGWWNIKLPALRDRLGGIGSMAHKIPHAAARREHAKLQT